MPTTATSAPDLGCRLPWPPGTTNPACPCCGKDVGWASISEDARLEPRNSYAASKLAQEHFASSWAQQTDGAVTSLRYHNVYGPRMPRDTPYAGVAAIFRSALEAGRPPVVYEDGGQLRDFVHVHDVAAANIAAIDRLMHTPQRSGGEVLACNVSSGDPHTVGELAAELSRAVRWAAAADRRRWTARRRPARGGRPGASQGDPGFRVDGRLRGRDTTIRDSAYASAGSLTSKRQPSPWLRTPM